MPAPLPLEVPTGGASSPAGAPADTSPAAAPRAGSTSLFQQIRWARLWLPAAIVGVVLVHQLLVVPLGGAAWRFWAQLLFYSILGPAVTYVTLDWIGAEVRERERAQTELARLFRELQSSHALLGGIQKVTERFAGAADLEATLRAATQGISEVTAARGAAVLLGEGAAGLTQCDGLDPELEADAAARSEALRRGRPMPEGLELPTRRLHVLSHALLWEGRLGGSVHAYYDRPPGPDQRESFAILAAEFSAAAEASRSRTRDLLTLFDVDRSIRAEGNLERLLETLLTQMMTRVGATAGGVYLLDEPPLLQLRALRGVGRAGALPLRIGEGSVGEVAQRNEPRLLPVVPVPEKENGGPPLRGAGSAVVLPLETDGAPLGVVVLAHPEERHFDGATLPFLGLLAGQVSLAVRNARAYLQSEELAIAEERARIAREIHDGVAQSLAFSNLKLDLVRRLLRRDPAAAELELDATKATIRELIKEVRRSIFALRPVDLERHGFVETIRRYTLDYGQQNDIQVELDVGTLPVMSVKSEAVLFRIFQEAMHNVAKHARAREVQVTLGTDDDGYLFVRVRDDGVGFDPATVGDRVTSAGGLGLRQMRERVLARGGRFEIASAPGGGTTLLAAVPE